MTERTPTDYALEFAEYMAKGAEQLIEAVNALALAEQARDEGDGDELDAKVDEARQDCTEFLTGLRNDIYQFRTRRDRAARAAPSLTVGERADGLTEEQIVTFLDAFQNDRKLLGDYEAFAGTARDIWAAALAPAAQAEPVAHISGVARYKVNSLIEQGYRVCGYTMEREGHRSAVLFDAAVRWLTDEQRHALMFVEGSVICNPPAQRVELPPLPEPDFSGDAVIEHGLYSADQMHAYARAAIAQAPATKEQP